jgi:hypothetical protein
MKNPKNGSGGFQKYLRKIFLVSIPLLLLQPVFGAQEHNVIVRGGWTNPIDSNNLISGAGSNLVNTYQSGVKTTTLTITGCKNNNDAWQVYVNRSDINWPINFVLYIKRTGVGDGTEGATVNGGLSFQAVNAAETFFLSGTGNRHNIPIQYQLSGVSLQTGPNNYSAGVIFTVIP